MAIMDDDIWKTFEAVGDSVYLVPRTLNKQNQEMTCDCHSAKKNAKRGVVGCGDNCLNRMLMMECGSKCPAGVSCTNKRFQKKQYCPLEVFKTENKGYGIRTLKAVSAGTFIIEYVGEIISAQALEERTLKYSSLNIQHSYFMAIQSDSIIDATMKGNCSRFTNHSCEPNCELQKWTVNKDVRIGFFATKGLQAGEEITLDYRFDRFGKASQKCYCMTPSCRGWIGAEQSEIVASIILSDWIAMK